MGQIMRLRRRATGDYGIKDSNNGYGHEKAFVDLVQRYGTLHESQLLPRSFGQGSLIRSQVDPDSLKQLAASLPTVVNGLKSGKVSPIKAIWHKKLPDQAQVRRIYEEVESRGERIELNLYIVGDDAENVVEGSDAGAEKPAMGDAAEVDTAARETEEEEADTQ
jgi:succinate dehydrogenase / fumarate reductase iron-sulfur subunit